MHAIWVMPVLMILSQLSGRASSLLLSSSDPGALGGQPGGYALASTNFIGWSFELSSTTTINSYSAMIYRGVGTTGTFTAQFIQLPTPLSLPIGSPFSVTETLLVQTNSISLKALDNHEFQLSSPLTLTNGNYALVLAAATANAVTVASNSVDYPGSRYFSWNGSQWQNGGVQNIHLAIYTVPEPSTCALLLLSGAASLWVLRRRKS